MFNVSKALILSAAAILSASTASAQDTINTTFRYDQALSIEKNYAAFELTAKRACDGMSDLEGNRAHRKCRAALIAQAVSATKLGCFIAHHQSRDGTARDVAALAR